MPLRTLLIIPSFNELIYRRSKVKAGVPGSPPAAPAVLAGQLLAENIETRILDLNIHNAPILELQRVIGEFKPKLVGITFTTPLFATMKEIAENVRNLSPSAIIIGGGPHASAMPQETLASTELDIVVIGEGDFILPLVAKGSPLDQIPNLAYKTTDGIKITPRTDFVREMDSLAFPAWQLYDIQKYRSPRFMVRNNPAGWIETSRGCPFDCCYCNKSVFGRTFRPKSPEHVIIDMEHMLALGFKELHIVDDMFTTDVDRVKNICRMIINKGLKFTWATVTGIRVDRGDQEMFDLMAKAGCYRVYFGIESGNQQIINNIGKDISIGQVRNAVRMARTAGIETTGFFVLALPGDTEKTMQETIDLAVSLDLDFAKVSIMTPLPATRIYKQLEAQGRLKTKDWTMYNLYMPANQLYVHDNLDWDKVNIYFNRFYRRFYLRPSFIWKRFCKSLMAGTLISDIGYFVHTRW